MMSNMHMKVKQPGFVRREISITHLEWLRITKTASVDRNKRASSRKQFGRKICDRLNKKFIGLTLWILTRTHNQRQSRLSLMMALSENPKSQADKLRIQVIASPTSEQRLYFMIAHHLLDHAYFRLMPLFNFVYQIPRPIGYYRPPRTSICRCSRQHAKMTIPINIDCRIYR
uniref:Uncharacterized protein n=1 Tax=Schistocephalus solidus TaxID=70667 RepID=A0A0V0J6F8_SCHSO